MSPFLGELVGTALLITLGSGVVANVVLTKTKGFNSGWIVITFGWAIAVFVGVFASASSSGAHLNPAVTIALAIAGKFEWDKVPSYILAQFIGACIGATLTWLAYKPHFDETEDKGAKLAVFCTDPAIRRPLNNLVSEAIATFIFMMAVFAISSPGTSLGSIDALPVAFVVLGVGLSLGGPTGYAINPIRDFGPRLMHAFLPIKGKGSSDWAYAWVPILGPMIGAILAAVVYGLMLK
jgi:glycerol uptake facilitator protein